MAISALILSACAGHQEHAHWNYEQPEKRGDEEVNKLCSVGQQQSPININTQALSQAKHFELKPHYQAQDFSVSNNGHTIVFNAKDSNASTLDVNGCCRRSPSKPAPNNCRLWPNFI